MKVGLLTFHSAHNYGAVLQAYATLQTLRELGADTSCINYQPAYLIKQRIFPRLKNESLIIKVKLFIEAFITFYWKFKRINGFNNFIKNKMNLTSEIYTQPKFNHNYDAYIMGSDQIWNVKLTRGFDAAFWGNFKSNKNALKISYAASMSNYNLSTNQKKQMFNLLGNFNSISVREEEAKRFIYDNFKINTQTVLDPTFLLGCKAWKTISISPKINKKYVLLYSIELREEAKKIAKIISKQLDAIVIELTMVVDKGVVFNKYQSASPEEYLGLFENAACIITSSFHGTAFSIIYNKPFYSIAQENDKDNRQITILKKLGLINRFINKNEIPQFKTIDYTPVNSKLAILREKSISFLKNSLKIH